MICLLSIRKEKIMEYEKILKKQKYYWKERLENLPGNPYVYGIYQMTGGHKGLFLPLRYWKDCKILTFSPQLK